MLVLFGDHDGSAKSVCRTCCVYEHPELAVAEYVLAALDQMWQCLQYEGGEPCSVCGHRLAPPAISSQRASAFPSAVLPSFLYLGSYDHASRSDALKMLEITHILNVSAASQTPSSQEIWIKFEVCCSVLC